MKSAFSQAAGDIRSFLKEAAQAPPDVPNEGLAEKGAVEESSQECAEESFEEYEEDVESLKVSEAAAESEDVLAQLNIATSKWKETGDAQLYITATVPLSTRMKEMLHNFKEKSAPSIHHVHDSIRGLLEKMKFIKPEAPELVTSPHFPIAQETATQDASLAQFSEHETMKEWALFMENYVKSADEHVPEAEVAFSYLEQKNAGETPSDTIRSPVSFAEFKPARVEKSSTDRDEIEWLYQELSYSK